MFFIKNKVEYIENKVSLCCNAKVYSKTDICSACKEHSDLISIKKDTSKNPWFKLSEAICDGGFKYNELIMLTSWQK